MMAEKKKDSPWVGKHSLTNQTTQQPKEEGYIGGAPPTMFLLFLPCSSIFPSTTQYLFLPGAKSPTTTKRDLHACVATSRTPSSHHFITTSCAVYICFSTSLVILPFSLIFLLFALFFFLLNACCGVFWGELFGCPLMMALQVKVSSVLCFFHVITLLQASLASHSTVCEDTL